MADFYNQELELCKEEEAKYALIDINEYHGLRKVLRLYKEQKEGKTEKNESRYKVLEQQMYKHQDDRTKFYGWTTTLLTPYSSPLDYKEVMDIVESELKAYLGQMELLKGIFEVGASETKISMMIQNYRLGKLEEDDYGIFFANLRYNGRNDVYELTLRSLRRIPFEIIQQIP